MTLMLEVPRKLRSCMLINGQIRVMTLLWFAARLEALSSISKAKGSKPFA
jgi:hypothetical protein